MTQTPPVRIRRDLVREAAARGERFHRSTKAQIEYWVMLGKQVDGVVDPDTLVDIESGAVALHVEPLENVAIDSGDLFDELQADRASGRMARLIADKSPLRYRASATHPGYLDRVDDATQTVTVGSFQDGNFTPLRDGEATPRHNRNASRHDSS